MKSTSLWVSWSISAIPLVSVVVFVIFGLDKLTNHWPMIFPIIVFIKSSLLSRVAPIEDEDQTITKGQRFSLVLSLLLPIVLVGLLFYLNHHHVIDNKSLIGLLIIVLCALWVTECHQLWKQHVSNNP
ncbi:MAG: hypothetical protein KZQ75_08035 [Candidatus Thiodiazotropha sp. (ex Myrtea spinifera)]|nr:hypothetical protein [Candidatus Thiodiazotropha sp. (ex Myrtea spinifera)]